MQPPASEASSHTRRWATAAWFRPTAGLVVLALVIAACSQSQATALDKNTVVGPTATTVTPKRASGHFDQPVAQSIDPANGCDDYGELFAGEPENDLWLVHAAAMPISRVDPSTGEIIASMPLERFAVLAGLPNAKQVDAMYLTVTSRGIGLELMASSSWRAVVFIGFADCASTVVPSLGETVWMGATDEVLWVAQVDDPLATEVASLPEDSGVVLGIDRTTGDVFLDDRGFDRGAFSGGSPFAVTPSGVLISESHEGVPGWHLLDRSGQVTPIPAR